MTDPLTDEEQRKSLVKHLRESSDMQVTHWMRIKAANEIERLEKIVEYLAREIAGREGIVRDIIDGADEAICSR